MIESQYGAEVFAYVDGEVNYPFTFEVIREEFVTVGFIGANGVPLPVPPSQFTVNLNAAVDRKHQGGTVTLTEAPDPSTVLFVAIGRETDITQLTDYEDGLVIPAATKEFNLDKLTMICQELQAVIGFILENADFIDDENVGDFVSRSGDTMYGPLIWQTQGGRRAQEAIFEPGFQGFRVWNGQGSEVQLAMFTEGNTGAVAIRTSGFIGFTEGDVDQGIAQFAIQGADGDTGVDGEAFRPMQLGIRHAPGLNYGYNRAQLRFERDRNIFSAPFFVAKYTDKVNSLNDRLEAAITGDGSYVSTGAVEMRDFASTGTSGKGFSMLATSNATDPDGTVLDVAAYFTPIVNKVEGGTNDDNVYNVSNFLIETIEEKDPTLVFNRFTFSRQGYLVLPKQPPAPVGGEPAYHDLIAATRKYVDDKVVEGGGIPEAPIDGEIYGRQNGLWAVVPTGGTNFLPLTGGTLTGPVIWQHPNFADRKLVETVDPLDPETNNYAGLRIFNAALPATDTEAVEIALFTQGATGNMLVRSSGIIGFYDYDPLEGPAQFFFQSGGETATRAAWFGTPQTATFGLDELQLAIQRPGGGVGPFIDLQAAGNNRFNVDEAGNVDISGEYRVNGTPLATGGEANTTSNLGNGEGLARPKSGVNLPFKSLIAGNNVNFDVTNNTITINSAQVSGDFLPLGGGTLTGQQKWNRNGVTNVETIFEDNFSGIRVFNPSNGSLDMVFFTGVAEGASAAAISRSGFFGFDEVDQSEQCNFAFQGPGGITERNAYFGNYIEGGAAFAGLDNIQLRMHRRTTPGSPTSPFFYSKGDKNAPAVFAEVFDDGSFNTSTDYLISGTSIFNRLNTWTLGSRYSQGIEIQADNANFENAGIHILGDHVHGILSRPIVNNVTGQSNHNTFYYNQGSVLFAPQGTIRSNATRTFYNSAGAAAASLNAMGTPDPVATMNSILVGATSDMPFDISPEQIGMILPQLVSQENGGHLMDYSTLVPLLLAVCKDLHTRVQALGG